ncbi:hypothetical protein [Lutibacter sp.]|uniref:hypothetical protein n=1 Tax=Lutibacter sp. TaxID=1925666 RepID=UPI00356AD46A
MKNLKLMGFLMLFASSLLFIQCTSDPIAGPQGIAGENGNDGSDGVDGNTACLQCHGQEAGSISSTIDLANAEYSVSGHATGVAYLRGTSAGCAECHSQEGYVQNITGQTVTGTAFPQPIGCKTCHDIHDPEKIEQGSTDFNLRNVAGTTLKISGILGTDITIDYGNTSNACITCHQPRKISNKDMTKPLLADLDQDAPYTLWSHFGPHYGSQATVFEGIQGEEIGGAIAYPTAGQSPHRTTASCVGCHMGETDKGTGGHSWITNKKTCNTCHEDKATTFFDEPMAELTTLLVEQGVLTGELNDEGDMEYHLNEIEMTVLQARAAWNWEMLHVDGSHGVHNPAYTKALLGNTIDAITVQ